MLYLDKDTHLNINAFHTIYKDKIIKKVIELSKNTILFGLTQNYSAEGGFELPLTPEWHDAIRIQNKKAYQYIDYHSTREFRFNYDNMTDKLYTKNAMKWWTIDEKNVLKDLIQIAINIIVK